MKLYAVRGKIPAFAVKKTPKPIKRSRLNGKVVIFSRKQLASLNAV